MATIVPPTVSTNSALLKGVSANPGAGGATQVPPGILALPAGTVLRGTIAQIDGRGNAVLNTAKGDVSLQTELPIKLGSEVALRLTTSSQGVKARILSINGLTPQEFSEKSANPRGQQIHVDDIVQTGKQSSTAKAGTAVGQKAQTTTTATTAATPNNLNVGPQTLALRGVLLSRADNLPQILQLLPTSIALPTQRLEAGATLAARIIQQTIQFPQTGQTTAASSTAAHHTANSANPASPAATTTATTTATTGATSTATPTAPAGSATAQPGATTPTSPLAAGAATTATTTPGAGATTNTTTPSVAATIAASATTPTNSQAATPQSTSTAGATPTATTANPTTAATTPPNATAGTTPANTATGPSIPPLTNATTPTAVTSTATTPTTTNVTGTTATPTTQAVTQAPITGQTTTGTPATTATTPGTPTANFTGTTPATTAAISAPTATTPTNLAATPTSTTPTATTTPATATTVNPATQPTTAANSAASTTTNITAATPTTTAPPTVATALSTQLGQGQLPAQVIGHEPSGETVVKTALGTLKVSIPSASGQPASWPVGTQFTLQLETFHMPQTLTNQGMMPTSAEPAPLSELSMNWKSLQETVEILAQTQPALATHIIDTIIPKPGPRMATATLFFISALRGGDIGKWLGDESIKILEQNNRGDLVRKLTAEFSSLRQFFIDSPSPNWQAAFLPVYQDDSWQQARMFLKKEPEGGTEGEPGGTRFIMEVDLSRMGPMQFDGFIRRRGEATSFDLIIRSRDALSSGDRQNIRDIYKGSSELTGFNGGISFQVTTPFPVLPMQEILSDAPDVMA